MKKIILSIIGIIGLLLFVTVFTLSAILFFRPTWIINPENLDFVLRKTHVLKTWKWKDAAFEHEWIKWNKRIIKGHFDDFCFEYESPGLDFGTCIEKISWNFELEYEWAKGFHSKSIEPILIRSSKTKVALKETNEPKPESAPPDIWRYWRLFWSPVIPTVDGLWEHIHLQTAEKKDFELDLKFIKNLRDLRVESYKFTLLANPESFELLAPRKYPFPKKIDVMPPLHFLDVKLTGKVKEDGIPLHLSGALEVIGFDVTSTIALPVRDDFASVAFRKKAILTTKAKIKLPSVKSSLSKMAKDPYRELPAPLNAMDGDIEVNIHTEDMKESNWALIKSYTHIDMRGGKQVLDMTLDNEVPLNLETFKPGSILVGIDFKEVTLQLPRLSKKSPPPQFLPDKRFKSGPYKKPEVKKQNLDLALHLDALNDEAMRIRSNLLDEVLRLNFDLFINEGNLQKGFVSVLPLKTSVFRRPIHVKQARVDFNYPKEPVIVGEVIFPLPEYKITLDLEGPVSKPRYHFRSEPPLEQNDIYSVLLFGRPMDDLDQSDKSNAQKTNQILAQGILSLSVLYFFAGSPVEYVGFNPETKKATAQIGLNSKTSLNIGRDQEGVNSSGIRRSLGKGWYLDTTIQSPSSSSQKNYGVILERVISY